MNKKIPAVVFLILFSASVFGSSDIMILSGDVSSQNENIAIIKEYEDSESLPKGVISSGRATAIAVLYCAGLDSKAIEDALSVTPSMFDLIIPFGHGIVDSVRYCRFIVSLIGGDTDLEDLPIPLVVVCQDFENRQPFYISKGSVFEALKASFAEPFIFTLQMIDSTRLMQFEGNIDDVKQEAQKYFSVNKADPEFNDLRESFFGKRENILAKINEYKFFSHVDMPKPTYFSSFSISPTLGVKPSFFYRFMTVKALAGVDYEVATNGYIRPFAGLNLNFASEHICFDLKTVCKFLDSQISAEEHFLFLSQPIDEICLVQLFQRAKTNVNLKNKLAETLTEVGGTVYMPLQDLFCSLTFGLRTYVGDRATGFIGMSGEFNKKGFPFHFSAVFDYEVDIERLDFEGNLCFPLHKDLDVWLVAFNDIELGVFYKLDSQKYIIPGLSVKTDFLLARVLEVPLTLNIGMNLWNKKLYFSVTF